jgi:hypothetical protein
MVTVLPEKMALLAEVVAMAACEDANRELPTSEDRIWRRKVFKLSPGHTSNG